MLNVSYTFVGCSCDTKKIYAGYGNCQKDYKGAPICYMTGSDCGQTYAKWSKGADRYYSWRACDKKIGTWKVDGESKFTESFVN